MNCWKAQSVTVFELKYFVHMWWNSMHVMRKCLTMKGLLQDIQKGCCSLFNK